MVKLFDGQVFNANEVPEREPYGAIPAGTYSAMVTASEMQATKDLKGEYLKLDIEIVEGEHAGYKIIERLNIKNQNQKATEIAYRTLADIGLAVGKITFTDSDELHNKRMQIVVEVEPGKPYASKDIDPATGKSIMKDGYPSNRIKKYMAAGSPAAATGGHATANQAISIGGAPVPPWKR